MNSKNAKNFGDTTICSIDILEINNVFINKKVGTTFAYDFISTVADFDKIFDICNMNIPIIGSVANANIK